MKKFIAILSLTALFLALSGTTFAKDTDPSSAKNSVKASVFVLGTPKHSKDETVHECLKAVRTSHLSNKKVVKDAFEIAMSSAKEAFRTAMDAARSTFKAAKIAAKAGTQEVDEAAVKAAKDAYLVSVKATRTTFKAAIKSAKESYVNGKADEKDRFNSNVSDCKK